MRVRDELAATQSALRRATARGDDLLRQLAALRSTGVVVEPPLAIEKAGRDPLKDQDLQEETPPSTEVPIADASTDAMLAADNVQVTSSSVLPPPAAAASDQTSDAVSERGSEAAVCEKCVKHELQLAIERAARTFVERQLQRTEREVATVREELRQTREECIALQDQLDEVRGLPRSALSTGLASSSSEASSASPSKYKEKRSSLREGVGRTDSLGSLWRNLRGDRRSQGDVSVAAAVVTGGSQGSRGSFFGRSFGSSRGSDPPLLAAPEDTGETDAESTPDISSAGPLHQTSSTSPSNRGSFFGLAFGSGRASEPPLSSSAEPARTDSPRETPAEVVAEVNPAAAPTTRGRGSFFSRAFGSTGRKGSDADAPATTMQTAVADAAAEAPADASEHESADLPLELIVNSGVNGSTEPAVEAASATIDLAAARSSDGVET